MFTNREDEIRVDQDQPLLQANGRSQQYDTFANNYPATYIDENESSENITPKVISLTVGMLGVLIEYGILESDLPVAAKAVISVICLGGMLVCCANSDCLNSNRNHDEVTYNDRYSFYQPAPEQEEDFKPNIDDQILSNDGYEIQYKV
ncbi:MAG: hypothetical protein SFW66_05565 [Gammaproteobacteria bacterium]|nr:hypothetical protein [Gammaproteobacteria bacterium]